ncbi:hypothetical protein FACS189475_07090 [Betaproteobacteria bacterium]|nr:hypothetical protein FACS189475_07090 [Betaproteobacteria bacterium]
MYISNWWGEFIGGTDDTCTLLDYFKNSPLNEFSLEQILSDFNISGRMKSGDFKTSQSVFWTDENGHEHNIDIDVDFLMDLSAVVLECLISGKVNLTDLNSGYPQKIFTIRAQIPTLRLLTEQLNAFAISPMAYDLAEMCDENDMAEIAAHCKAVHDSIVKVSGSAGVPPALLNPQARNARP